MPLLQFDTKSGLDEIGEVGLAHLRRIIGSRAGNIIVSATDLELIAAMRDAMPDVARGIDPSVEIAEAWRKDGLAVAARALEAALAGPSAASTIYLHYPLVLKAADHGLDMIAISHQAGMLVDVWTFKPVRPDAGLSAGELDTIRRLLELARTRSPRMRRSCSIDAGAKPAFSPEGKRLHRHRHAGAGHSAYSGWRDLPRRSS